MKRVIEWWKNLTIALALPLMVVNTIMDYYNGWESRALEKEEAKKEEEEEEEEEEEDLKRKEGREEKRRGED